MTDFIGGVYNYCDRWCERCPLTEQCRLFASRHEGRKRSDHQNEEFWRVLMASIETSPENETSPVDEVNESADAWTEPWAREVTEDWTTSLGETFEDGSPFRRAQDEPLASAAREYATAVHDWLEKHDPRGKTPEAWATGVSVDDGLEVINWYSTLIAAKLSRALLGHLEVEEESRFDDPNNPLFQWPEEIEDSTHETAGFDRDGSAKVALIGIERSFGAWTHLLHSLPEHGSTIRGFQGRLARLRIEIDRLIPGARVFKRPGFDA